MDEDVVIPDGVTSIGDSAFYGCSSLTSIEIPDSVTNIHESAFEKCYLQDVKVSEATVKKIGIPKARSFFNTSEKLYPYLKGEFIPSCEAIRKLIISDVNRKDGWMEITDYSLHSDDATTLAKFLDLRKKVSIEEIETLIEACSKQGSIAVQAFLIDYMRKKFTLEQMQEDENVRVEKELGLRDKTLADWRKEFAISFVEHNAVIGCYKGNEKTVCVPAKVGPHAVIAIRDKAFAYSTVSTVYISEGIKTLGRQLFRGSLVIQDVYIPASVTRIAKDCINKTTRIHAPAGSYAETYAKKNKIPFIAE